MLCVVQWWDVLFVKGMHFSSKNAHLLKHVILNFLNPLQSISPLLIERSLKLLVKLNCDETFSANVRRTPS